MALTVTIGGAASDSYATLAEYTTRATAMGWTLAGTDAANEVNLRKAALSVDVTYLFVGMRQYQTQAREWPRIGAGLVNGWPVDPDTIPQAVKDAQMELAYLIQGGAVPLDTIDGVVSAKRVKAGPVEAETTYIGGKGVARYTGVDRLLRPYLAVGQGQIQAVRG